MENLELTSVPLSLGPDFDKACAWPMTALLDEGLLYYSASSDKQNGICTFGRWAVVKYSYSPTPTPTPTPSPSPSPSPTLTPTPTPSPTTTPSPSPSPSITPPPFRVNQTLTNRTMIKGEKSESIFENETTLKYAIFILIIFALIILGVLIYVVTRK